MKKKFISALFLGCMMLVPSFAHAETSDAEATATKTEAKTGWEKFAEKLPKLSGYLQTGWNYNSLGNGSSSFQAKRLRLIMDGNVHEKISFRLQVEAFNGIGGSRNPNGQKDLQVMDAFVTAKINEAFQVRAGQYYLPIGYENYDISPATLETVDFSNICYRMVCRNALGYDFVEYGRDLGVMLMGNLFKNEQDNFYRLSYNLSLSNGHLPAMDDNNKSKDIVASLTFRPIKLLNIKASYAWGEYNGVIDPEAFGFDGISDDIVLKNQSMHRAILGVWYNNPQGLDVRAEYGHTQSKLNGSYINKEDSFYTLVGYHLGKFLPVVRYDFFRDKVRDTKSWNYDRFLVGLTYVPCKHVKLQANYAYTSYTDKAAKALAEDNSHQIQLMGIFSF